MAETPRVTPDNVDALVRSGQVLLLDVREPAELQEFGTLEGAVNIPIGQLEARLDELPKDRPILTA